MLDTTCKKMVAFENVCFYYHRNVPIIHDFNLEIGEGEICAIIAPSGYGKTTLLYLLAGLYLPVSGRISVKGSPLSEPRLSTGLILQDYGLLPWATAFDNVSLGLRIRDVNSKKTIEITREWLEKLNITLVSHHYPPELSGGQRQRVAIARTLAISPDLLLMDEPFASLDALPRESLQNLIIDLHNEMPTITVVLVTHSIEEAVFLGKKILVIT